MRHRDRILTNLETTYRETYERARSEQLERRMEELDAAYQRDQLMLEVLLDIRDLFAQVPAPTAADSPGALLEKLDTLRRISRIR